MLLKTVKLSIVIFSMTLHGFSQGESSIPSLSGLTDCEIKVTRTFSESSLYGYINGGAELYLEYGFDTLVVSELNGCWKRHKCGDLPHEG